MDSLRRKLTEVEWPGSTLTPGEIADKIKGCVFGGALGDALGLYTEMIPTQQATEMWTSLGGLSFDNWTPRPHVMQFERGDWTDDTDLALAILDSFLAVGQTDVKDLHRRFKDWLDHGYPELGDEKGLGTGSTITGSLNNPIALHDPSVSGLLTWCNLGQFDLGTTGAVMRTAPVALCHYGNLSDLVGSAVQCGTITHADPRSVAACVAIDVAIGALLLGMAPGRAIDLAKEIGESALVSYTDSLSDAIGRAAQVLSELHQEKKAEELVSQYKRHETEIRSRSDIATFQATFNHSSLQSIEGIEDFTPDYAYKILAITIWAIRQQRSFSEVLLDIVKAGGDADTNAAVACSVYGTCVGFSALPQDLVARLVHKDWLSQKLDRLLIQLHFPSS